jgi:hypothetical protein
MLLDRIELNKLNYDVMFVDVYLKIKTIIQIRRKEPTQDIHFVFLLRINRALVKSIVNSHQVTRKKRFQIYSKQSSIYFLHH